MLGRRGYPDLLLIPSMSSNLVPKEMVGGWGFGVMDRRTRAQAMAPAAADPTILCWKAAAAPHARLMQG